MQKYESQNASFIIHHSDFSLHLRGKRNGVQSRAFSEMLQKTLTAYHNRAIATQEMIDELIQLAKEMQAAPNAAKTSA